MTIEIAERLKPIFKRDFKKARFKCACIAGNGKYYNNHNSALIRKYDRLSVLNVLKHLVNEVINHKQVKQQL